MALDDTFISESKKLFQNHHPATHDFVAGTPLPEGEGELLKQPLGHVPAIFSEEPVLCLRSSAGVGWLGCW